MGFQPIRQYLIISLILVNFYIGYLILLSEIKTC